MHVLIADGHKITHAGLRAQVQVCYRDAETRAASDLASALRTLNTSFIDLVIADATLPGWNLALFARQCHAQGAALLLYTSADYTPTLHRTAQQLGIQGYLTKADSLSKLRRALRGLRYTPQYPDMPPINADEAQRVNRLSLAELEVVAGVVDGLTLGEIALQRGRALSTVQSQMKSIRRKLEVSSKRDAAAMVLRVQGAI